MAYAEKQIRSIVLYTLDAVRPTQRIYLEVVGPRVPTVCSEYRLKAFSEQPVVR